MIPLSQIKFAIALVVLFSLSNVFAQEVPPPAPAAVVNAGATACKLMIKRSIERVKLAKRLKCEITTVDEAFLKEDAASYEKFCVTTPTLNGAPTQLGLNGDWSVVVEPNEKEMIRVLAECVEKKIGFGGSFSADTSDYACKSKVENVIQNPIVVAPHGVKCDGKDNKKSAMCIYQGFCSIKSASLNFNHPFVCPIDAATLKCPDFDTCFSFGKKAVYNVREAQLTGVVAEVVTESIEGPAPTPAPATP